MRKGLNRGAVIVLGFLLLAGMAAAAPVNCAGVADITTLGSDGCTLGGLTFTNFNVSTTGNLNNLTVGIANSGAGTGVVGSDVDLVFQYNPNFTGGVETGDLLLTYEVMGGIIGVDNLFQATPEGGSSGYITITEIVCTQAFSGSVCGGTTLANFQATSSGGNPGGGSATFAATDPAFIKKDISFNSATMSEFSNSQLVPEPMTLSLMGMGLLGIGLLGRKLRK